MMAFTCGWSGANALTVRSEFFSGAALRAPACRSSPCLLAVRAKGPRAQTVSDKLQTMAIHQALTHTNHVRNIFCRHEQGEIFAAEGYAKSFYATSSGRVDVCMATSGPGVTNLVTGLADASLDSVSLVSITGRVPRRFIGTDAFQDTPIVEVAGSIARRLQPKGHFKQRRGQELLGVRAETGSDAAGSGYTRRMLAVFLSGGGSNFRALHTACLNNSIYGDVAVVVSDKPGCKGCEYAREHKLPVLTYPLSKHAQDGLSAPDLMAALRNYGVDYIVLAGYLKLLPPELVQAYPQSIVNIHPALLPSFGGKGLYGMKVHEAVIKSGARFSGATVHFVDENFDTGPILAQRIVPVLSDDTPQDLAAKVLKVEHLLYSEAVAALCEDRIFWRDDGVPLIRKSWNEAEYC